MNICIDPGHGGRDSGAKIDQPFSYMEKKFNFDLSTKLKARLEQNGNMVFLTREDDVYVDLDERAFFANDADVDVFVSIHANAASNTSAQGMEVYHFVGSNPSQQLANLTLQNMLYQCPGHINRGVKTANYTVLRMTLMPAILVECEFITNPQQATFLRDLNNQTQLANAIATGIEQFGF
jgi:N-acetylmuramoyl-L-alanine amidase